MASRTSDSINESESVDNTMGLPSLDSISHDDHSKSVERSLMTNSAEYDHLVASGAIGAMHHLKRLEREKKISKRPEWHCPFDKTGLLRVWRTPRHHLKTDDERHAFRLIQKYNGSYSSYMDTVRQSQRRQQRAVKDGSHIQWEKLGKVVSKDMDYRARQLLREIDRATFTKNEYIHSDVLHANDQRFPTNVLRVQLEDTLDNLLSDQIKERERAEKMRVTDSDSESDDDLPMIGEDAELSMDDSGTEENGNIMEKIKKRAKKRQQLRRRMKEKEETLQDEVMKARKIVKGNKGKSGVELAEAILRSQLGVNGCLACRVKRCKWQPCVDIEICTNRINLLDRELERVRLDRDAAVFESDICLSAQLGGNRIFKRHDLVDELVSEKREIERRFDLNNVDKELHDSYNCRTEYFESRFLHGYAMMMWTNNARKALEARQNRLVALSVAKEAVDGILDWMLEGWYFGERESQFSVLGYVPSIKPSGKVAAGLDQVTAMTTVVSKMKERANNKRKGIETDQTRRGVIMEKAWQVEQNAQKEYKSKKVARDGNEHEHLLNETESTLKFGIFMLTLMYFRAMALVKREQRSWNAEDEEFAVPGKGKQLKKMTDERMRMLDEESKAAARKKKIDLILARSKVGEQRRREREAMERREAIIRLHQLVSQQKKELYAVTKIQKIYRGHLGRKAAKRWALKRAELGAMTALLNSTAIAIQRVYRGYVARELAVIKRTEMAQFIALMRVQEAEADEDIYWQTHPWTRFKRDKKEWLAKKLLQRKKQNVLGGARLTEEEQALLEGKTIAEIRAQVNEFKEEDEDELPAGLRRSVRESAKSRRSSVSSVFTMSSRRSSLDDNESERIGVSTSESQR